jgi:long-chain acyl-CoA synthetase
MSARVDFRRFKAELKQRTAVWGQSAVFAREKPNGIAIYSSFGNRTFAALNENANRLANAMRARGLMPGDGIALMCRNRPEFLEVFLAAMRIGLRLTPINTHLTAREVAYIVTDSQAQLLFMEPELLNLGAQNVGIGKATPIIEIADEVSVGSNYAQLIATASADEPANMVAGTLMLYTSGTTGKPKGVWRELPESIEPQYDGTFANYNPLNDTVLCCGPAYHSAPLLFDLQWPLASGVPIVMLEKWDACSVLDVISKYKISHAHMVATMFQRLLAIAPVTRHAYDLSSLRLLIHGAAPCPVPVKRAMIEWLGPVLVEYYGATEGGNGINVTSEVWLQKPGTVGKVDPLLGHVILDTNGEVCVIGKVGKIFFQAPKSGRFSYFGDPEKTASAYVGDRFTLGDLGYLDADGYLFLTGRVADCIISGGVNIYPQEIDDVLLNHPAVKDVCTVGVPDDEWGEKVVSVIVLKESERANDHLSASLVAHVSATLAPFKRPRRIVFTEELPRTATGKLLRQQVRALFWAKSNRSI